MLISNNLTYGDNAGIVAPFIGAALAVLVWKLFFGKKQETKEAE